MSMNLKTTKRNNLYLSIATVLGGFAFFATGTTYAAAPAAGTNISNIATASYVDGTSTTRTVTSNEVKTTVLQVGSFTLVQDRTTTANPNSAVALSHVLTNTGNGTDEFTLGLANVSGDAFDFSNIAIYLDANKDGVPDNNTNLMGQKVSLNAGESIGLVVVGTTSTTAKLDELGKLELSATSKEVDASATGKTIKNTDSVKIVTGASFAVTKSASVSVVDTRKTAQAVTYQLNYVNKGNSTDTLIIEDTLDSNLAFDPTRHQITVSGTVLGTNSTANAYYAWDSLTKKLTITIKNVAANTSGIVKFEAEVKKGTAAGVVPNTAMFDADGPNTNGSIPDQPTNRTDITVQSFYTGVINDSSTKATALGEDDVITIATASQGAQVRFGTGTPESEVIYVHNTGNVTDTFKVVTAAGTNLPPGAIVSLFKSDGVTPLTSSIGSDKDTGPIAAGGKYQIVAVVSLPTGFTGISYNDNPIQVVLKTTASQNASATDTITLKISEVTALKVDLSNGGTGGIGPDNGNVVDKKSTQPGKPITFDLAIKNEGTQPDNYNLGISSTLPNGWTVEFFAQNADGSCSASKLTNSGTIQPGATVKYCAVVTPSVNAVPTDSRDIVFTINSPATGLTDSLKDHLDIEAARKITFVADQTGQVAPGGSIIYKHTLTNNGNVIEGLAGNTLPVEITQNSVNSGFVTSIYVDQNNNGIAEASELVTGNDLTAWLEKTGGTTSAFDGLSPNETVNIFVKVEAPSSATAGQSNLSIIKIAPGGANAPTAVTVTDKTTVNIGQVRLEKTQALDADCSNGADGAFGTSPIGAKPGACIVYRIKATNEGNGPVSKVVITDVVPNYTTLGTSPAPKLDPGTTADVTTTNGQLKSKEFDLTPLESVTMEFSVKVDEQ
ncbi:COG1470 family protein [Acinetobacter johnsonii]|uniref:COG1470 family protein n=1 Tax=Acinetobacter johnsonii TaxID=40214 RepID=UPI00249096D6|nr:NEW3 domain-containing protein [Acinetobacter johnsonii]